MSGLHKVIWCCTLVMLVKQDASLVNGCVGAHTLTDHHLFGRHVNVNSVKPVLCTMPLVVIEADQMMGFRHSSS